MTREVCIVAGLAMKAPNLAPFARLGQMFAETAEVHYVNGAELVDGQLLASGPLDQAKKVIDVAANSDSEETLIVTHSLGAAAAVLCLEQQSTTDMRCIAIAPPLPSPYKVLHHERMKRRLEIGEDGIKIPSYSFALGNQGPSDTPPEPIDVFIPTAYFEQTHVVSSHFSDMVKALTDSGKLQIVAPTQDWNRQNTELAGLFSGTVYIDAPHSLQGTTDEIENTCKAIHEMAVEAGSLV